MIANTAEKHRVSTSRDTDGTTIIVGDSGHIYEHADEQLAVLFMPTTYRPRLWAANRKKCLAAGMTPLQEGDGEGCFAFDASNGSQLKLALKVAGVRRKRHISEAQKAELASRLRRHVHKVRENLAEEGHFASQDAPPGSEMV